ncbi:M23 family metallopeptidase [Georgenia sp. Z1491]|uniref:M23 family metallopeptidase n=1 Tax=Georgenia sp. Z1491 TaxID=3416707 RepID=UPI003CE71DF7
MSEPALPSARLRRRDLRAAHGHEGRIAAVTSQDARTTHAAGPAGEVAAGDGTTPAVEGGRSAAPRVRRRDLRETSVKATPARPATPVRPTDAPADAAPVARRSPSGAHPTRRELRARTRPARRRSRAVRTSVVAAAAAVGTLGVALPAFQHSGATAEAQLLAGPQVEALTAPTYSVLNDGADTGTTVSSELLASGGADARATYAAASRTEARSELRCSPDVAASGTRAALASEETVVRPLESGTYRDTSGYGWRTHPITGSPSFHTGDDWAAPFGTPIHAVADGVVTHAGEGIEGRSGTLVIIEHEVDGRTFETWSTHMSPSGVHVQVGDTVSAGQHIADVGSWGNSTGPHLHLEVHVDGETVAPNDYLASLGAVEPSEAC